jgi:hypothetical protein
MGISKLTCTLKGVTFPEKLLEADALKDLREAVHHRVPLSLERFFEQDFDGISCPLVFLLVRHGRPSGFARLVLQRFNQFKP